MSANSRSWRSPPVPGRTGKGSKGSDMTHSPSHLATTASCAFLPFTRYHHAAGIPLEEAIRPAPGAGRGLEPPFGMNGADCPVKCHVEAPNIGHRSLL